MLFINKYLALNCTRYPDDTLDRLWYTEKTGPTNQTSLMIVDRLADSLPLPVVQTSYAAPTAAGFFVNFTDGLDTTTSYYYYLALFFAEIDPRVNASGLRVFDVTINESPFYPGYDVYAEVGQYTVSEIYSSRQLGPYTDHVLINFTSTPTSVYPPFISAAEILQLFDNPMVPTTSSVDSKLLCFHELVETIAEMVRGHRVPIVSSLL